MPQNDKYTTLRIKDVHDTKWEIYNIKNHGRSWHKMINIQH